MITAGGRIILAVAGRIILAVLLWLVYAAFAIALVGGGLTLAVAFLGPLATVGIVAILIGVALIYAYVPLRNTVQPAKPRTRARKRA
jgi:hypothetical protein